MSFFLVRLLLAFFFFRFACIFGRLSMGRSLLPKFSLLFLALCNPQETDCGVYVTEERNTHHGVRR